MNRGEKGPGKAAYAMECPQCRQLLSGRRRTVPEGVAHVFVRSCTVCAGLLRVTLTSAGERWAPEAAVEVLLGGEPMREPHREGRGHARKYASRVARSSRAPGEAGEPDS